MNTSSRAIAIAGLILAITSSVPAQTVPTHDPARLTIDRLYDTDDFATHGFGPVRWLEDGTGYTALERGEIVRYEPETGDRTVIVSKSDLTPRGEDETLGVADYAWSNDGRKLMIFTNTRRVWRANTRGDYWVLDRASADLRRLGGDDLERTWFQFAKFSPDGDHAAWVHRNDLYVEDLATGAITRLTDTGSETVSNGTFDWVYEEEWGLRDGFRWSPDGAHIAFWQIDAAAIPEFVLVDYTSELYPVLKRFRYPKVGTENPRCRVGVIPAGGGDVAWMKLPGDERDNYVAMMEWAPPEAGEDPHELVVQRLNRRQNVNRVIMIDIHSGLTKELLRDDDETWVELWRDLEWLDDGRTFTFVSEGAGWRHLYVVGRDGQLARPVTSGAYDVLSVVGVDETGGFVYFIASPDDPTRRFLFRVPLAGGDPERLTPAEARGTHGYQMSPDARYAIHTASSFGSPPTIDLVSLPDHAVLRTFVTNDDARAALRALDGGPEEFLRLPITSDLEVDAWAIKPPDFDPTRSYPLIVHVYGEPAGQTVRDTWGGGNYLWHRLLAQHGYIVVSFDNRGTPAPRGRDWRKSVYGQIGILASEDQAAALRALLDRWDYVDRDRVGVWGWSGGGSMTLNALFRYPDLYRAGVAIAFVADQRLYDTIYQERYMGLPDDNPDGFRDGSPITFAHQLQGDVLLVYGTGDDNCHYQNCERLINELVRHGKQFDMLAYPGRSHGIHEGEGTRKHLYTAMTNYLLEHVPAGRATTDGAYDPEDGRSP